MNYKRIARGIRFKLGKATSEDYCSFLRNSGIRIGKKTVLFDYKTNVIDTQRPWLMEIGSYCKICRGVIILAHDYSRSVLRRVYGDIVGEAEKTKIGDNVFIGINSIILMGTHVGNNVIIGAGSVVRGEIPDNVVAAGNPAKVICTLDEYYNKRKKLYKDEAKACVKEFYSVNHRTPAVEEMGAFFPLYLKRDVRELRKNNIHTKLSGDEEESVIENFLKSKAVYACYDDFLKDAMGEDF